ncbi:polysaccharide biosynthesis protein [Bacillus sp. X1(2014)]|jgi:O-antigen/teichoic acid export membrane protein|nr:polysaccharide biosynthesis protein [Bacillus sp. X1(2014)]
MNSLLKKFIGFSIGPVVGALIAFITIPLTTYFLSPAEYGKASMFSIYQVLISTFLYLGLDQSYTREFHDSKDKVNLIKNALLLPLVISLLLFLFILINLNNVSKFLFDSSNYSFAVILFAISIIFLVIERFILLSVRMEERALEFSIVNIVLKLNVLILTLFFVFFIRRDFLAAVYATSLGQIVTDIYLIIRYKKYLDFRNFYFDKKLFLKLLKFGAPLIIAASLNNLLNSIDRIALKTWSNFYEIGIFTAAFKISATLIIVRNSFTSFWVPVAYRWHSQNKDIKYFELVSHIVLFTMSVLFVLILIFKNLIVVLLSDEYVDAIYIIGLLCLYPIMYTLSETTALGISFSKKSVYNIWVSLLSILPNVILSFILVPKYGAIGAAIATGFSYLVFFLARSYFSTRHWTGFPIKIHLLITFILFIAALINTQNLKFINFINIGLFLLIILIQAPIIRKVISIYKNNQEWDFS